MIPSNKKSFNRLKYYLVFIKHFHKLGFGSEFGLLILGKLSSMLPICKISLKKCIGLSEFINCTKIYTIVTFYDVMFHRRCFTRFNSLNGLKYTTTNIWNVQKR